MKRHASLLVTLVVIAVSLPFIAMAADPAPPAPPSALIQMIVQNLWIVVMLTALYVLSPLVNKLAAKLEADAQSKPGGSLAQRLLHLGAVLAHCAAQGVVQVESELRPTIKSISEDGKITADEGARLRQEASARGLEFAKTCYPEILDALGLDKLMTMIAAHVPTQAALLAGNSRAALDNHDDTSPGAPPHAVPQEPAKA